MEIVKGYIHPVREDIDTEALKVLKSVRLDLSVDPYVCAITDESVIDSFGLKCKLSLFDKANNYEVIGFTLEAGVIFSSVGNQREDLNLIADVLADAYAMAMNLILEHTPQKLIKLDSFDEQDTWGDAAKVMAKLVEYGLYS